MNLSYQLTFTDGTTFKGNSLDGSWKKAPDKPIKEFVYFFGTKKIVLKDYKSYNHLIEKVNVVGKRAAISLILLIGRKTKESHLVIIDFQQGKMFSEVVEIGKEYHNQEVTGWRNGLS